MPQTNTQGQKATLTLTIPSWILEFAKMVDYGAGKVADKVQSVADNVSKSPRFKLDMREKFGKIKNKFSFKSYKKAVIFAAILIAVGAAFAALKATGGDPQAVVGGVATNSVGGQVNVNRKFEVPIKTKEGKETGEKLLVTVTMIEKTPNILIQNKPAKTKEGKTFLILNMEIQNDTKTQLKVKPVDMVRLVGEDGRNYAPDVHNNEVNAEPVSIKKTKIGYVVDEPQNKFKLLIGEVRGSQETIEVEF